jgi:membrane protein implicated in regulation of membrane protease activity
MWLLIVLWLIIGGAALAIDVISSSFLFIWFTVGAIAAVIAAFMQFSFAVQLTVFILVSVTLMIIGYPIVKKALKKTVQKTPTTEQGYVGRELIADENVIERATIKIDGIYWTVKNEGEFIKKGDKVKITGIEGNKIVIKKI